MLIHGVAIEPTKAMRIIRKVSGYPVQQHAETRSVTRVHQGNKILRRTKPTGGRIHAGRLITPRAVERMLHDGQKLDMGEAHIARILGKLLGELTVCEPLFSIIASTAPGTKMHFVNRNGSIQRVYARWCWSRPRQLLRVDHDRCCTWPQ